MQGCPIRGIICGGFGTSHLHHCPLVSHPNSMVTANQMLDQSQAILIYFTKRDPEHHLLDILVFRLVTLTHVGLLAPT